MTVEADEDGGRSAIVADASLGEALHNLVDNAANANARSAVRDAAVELRICVEGADVVVEVADRGPGIEPVPAARAVPPGAHGEGMGVGLILAQAALESHGGRLEFRPRPGGGTIACLRIPARRTRT